VSRWLVVGEGPSEIGTVDRQGFLGLLLQVLADDADPALVKALGCPEWAPTELPQLEFRRTAELVALARLDPPQPRGAAKTAARTRKAARLLQCDAIVFLTDNDRARREKGKTKRDLVVEELDKGQLPHAAGVAKETLEAWISADPDVLAPVSITISKQPEEVWGERRDPDSEHPKHVLRRALEEAGVEHRDALKGWSLVRAARRAPNLRLFCTAIIDLMRDPLLCQRRVSP